jgi:hydroxymethylbilane synthase
MNRLRVGTRGSDLAVWQTNWVCDRLRAAHPSLEIEQVIIKTHGDVAVTEEFGRDWPVGAFVSALERTLAEERIDFAVHSYKDLPTAQTPGLTIAAIPIREVVHDVLLSRGPVALENLPTGFRVGTGSPRRSAQFRRLGNVEIVPIRGNVQTRIDKIEREGLDGVVLAAAGLKRLGIVHPHMTDLPTDRFVPSPAQGALAVQTRTDSDAADLVRVIDDAGSRAAVVAERSFLERINAGCHVPVAALAGTDGRGLSLHAQLFDDAAEHMAEGTESGGAPEAIGMRLADRLVEMLKNA